MNALQFIEKMATDGVVGDYNAGQAYDIFKENGGSGSFPYFRTKFNNKKKELGIKGQTAPSNVTYKPAPNNEIEDNPKVVLPKRVVKNYKNGDEIPEVPGMMPTGTLFDEIISDRITTDEQKKSYFDKTGEEMPDELIEIGGFTRKCADIRAGGAGAGKTYLSCILAAKAKVFARREQGKEIRVGLISGEMRDTEWAKELSQCELLKEIEVDYMLDYVGFPNYEDIFWEAVADYDIVIIDSLPAIISHFKMSWDTNKGKMPTEAQMMFSFIQLLLKSVKENNNNVQVINQANKDGNYKGGTELPHMLSSMSFVKIDGSTRYLIFDKNRNNGKVKRKAFFSKLDNGDIQFNVEAYEATYKKVNDKKEDIDSFLMSMHADQQRALNESGEGSATERTAFEMGTGGETPEERAELEDATGERIPLHLRAEEGEDNFKPTETDAEGQINLETQIKFEEDQARLKAIEERGHGIEPNPHFMPSAGNGVSQRRLRAGAEGAIPRLDLEGEIVVPEFLPDPNAQEEE